jgi:hypothetical protein
VIAANATEATKIRSIVCVIPGRDVAKNEEAPGEIISGGFWTVETGYIRQSQRYSLSESRHLIMCSMWQRCVISVTLFRQKTGGGQLAFVPISGHHERRIAIFSKFARGHTLGSVRKKATLGAIRCT